MAESTDGASNGSVSTFVSSLVFNVVLAAAILIAFCVLRPRFKRVYAPRTYAVEKECVYPLSVRRWLAKLGPLCLCMAAVHHLTSSACRSPPPPTPCPPASLAARK
ncbi:hypothetical protein IWQ57_006744 [Coemansia nantahalensis]|uniref:Uncharacterized protein n=1 Tax=Coemansia nantahalensis TaxID=2789366 RepID=A0ACC1JIS6_9FUNG|nr:hypothetical protein IWQ57_006744 [Coemansia nantahalensis]